ncbi:MAG: DM13 domain-containing protein [Anaerolineae bacterium]
MNVRFRITLLLFGTLLVIVTYTFPLWAPVLENNTVEELFPGLPPEAQPTFAAFSATQQSIFLDMQATNPVMAREYVLGAMGTDFPVPTEQQVMPTMEAPLVVGSGQFGAVDEVRWAEGTFLIYQQPDNNRVLRIEDFRSARATDLHVILWATDFPSDEVDIADMLAEPVPLGPLDIDLGALQGNVGNQNYTIPPQVNLNLYNSIVIYSITYQMIFSVAPIE